MVVESTALPFPAELVMGAHDLCVTVYLIIVTHVNAISNNAKYRYRFAQSRLVGMWGDAELPHRNRN